LKGALIVHEKKPVYKYDSERIVQLTDWYHMNADGIGALGSNYVNATLNPDGNEPLFNSGLINGKGQFDCRYTTRKCVNAPHEAFHVMQHNAIRLRFINLASFASFMVSLDGHDFTVIEVDGVLVHPFTVKRLNINIAQRYS